VIFVSNELAARIESAETELLHDIIQGSQQRRPDLDAWSERIAGGCAGYAGPGVPVNKIAGIGFAGVPDADALGAIERRYHERESGVSVEVATHADPEVFAFLMARGYRLTGFEDVLGVALPVSEGRRAEQVQLVTVAPGAEREPWFDCLIEGFAAPDEQGVQSNEDFPRDLVREVMRDLATIPDFTAYLARLDGEDVGGGALRTHGAIAHLCGAATVPAARRRGVQTTLLTERLQAAASAGCEIAVAFTQPGSKSQQNMIRQGFCLLYSRAILTLPTS